MSEDKIPIKFPEVNIPDKPVRIAVEQLITEINSKMGASSERLRFFIKKYEEEFTRKFIHDAIGFEITETEVLCMMKGPLIFYALNMNAQVLIDLVGLLERYAIIYIERLFKSLRSVQLFSEAEHIIEKIMERKHMKDLAIYLIALGLWDKADQKQIHELNDRRNYVAHKNLKETEGILGPNKIPISVPKIDLAMSEFDVLPYMFYTIRLLFKLLDRFLFKTENSRIAKALLDSKIQDKLEYFRESVFH